jgi:hypothetical protein
VLLHELLQRYKYDLRGFKIFGPELPLPPLLEENLGFGGPHGP